MMVRKFDSFISESGKYPGRLKNFYEEQSSQKSYDNIFSTLFEHLDIWYAGYKVKVTEFEITVTLKSNLIYSKLMTILSELEESLQKSGYNEPEVFINCKKRTIVIRE